MRGFLEATYSRSAQYSVLKVRMTLVVSLPVQGKAVFCRKTPSFVSLVTHLVCKWAFRIGFCLPTAPFHHAPRPWKSGGNAGSFTELYVKPLCNDTSKMARFQGRQKGAL